MPEEQPKPPQKLTKEQAAQIRAARLAAAVRKVKEGRSLTLGEQTLIDSMTEPDRADRSTWPRWCSSQAQAAAVAGLPIAVIRAAKRQGCPAFAHSRVDPRALVDWLDARKGETPASAPGQVQGAAPVKRTLAEEIEDLGTMLAQMDALSRDSFARGDVPTGVALQEQTKSLWERRKAAQIELRRQGRTEEDVVPKSELERMAHAIAHHLVVGVQAVAVDIVRAIEGITDPARQLPLVEAALLPVALVRPIEHASGVGAPPLEAGHGLPVWVGEAMARAVREVVR